MENLFFTPENYVKLYQDRNWLVNEYLTLQKTPKQIAKSVHVSYKLINRWLIDHGLIERTPETKVP
jgi:hypothetical protein